jgi:hypothetical protein
MKAQNPVSIFCSGVFYCLLICTLTFAAKAELTAPFVTHNQNPLLMVYGLPLPTAAQITEHQQSQLLASLNFSNTINTELPGNEIIFIDAESYQLNLVLDYGFSKNWALRIQTPFIRHGEGFMDSRIDDYHNALGLPEGARPLFPRDQLHIEYQNNGISQIDIQKTQSGMGDISLQTGYQSIRENDFNLSYWASLKLPTGDAKKLTGSGHTDLALWISADKSLNNNLSFYSTAGILYMTDSDVLKSQHKNTVAFATAGMQGQPWEKIILKLQFDMHSAFYDSTTDFLGPVVQLTFGGSILFDSSSLDIAVAEDIQVAASPDVNFNFTWRYRY